jgi:hypothetical protein
MIVGWQVAEHLRADLAPLRNLGDVELITVGYVGWYNQQRLMHRLRRIPPVEAEACYYAEHMTGQPADSQNREVDEARDASDIHLAFALDNSRTWIARGCSYVAVSRRQS